MTDEAVSLLRPRKIEDMTIRTIASKTKQGCQRLLKCEIGSRCGDRREEDAQLKANFLRSSNKIAWACPSSNASTT
jgi:hypothetical protein